MTNYIILASEDLRSWQNMGGQEARSSDSAIREWLSARSNGATAKHYVAIPIRSWKAVTVEEETKTTFKFSR